MAVNKNVKPAAEKVGDAYECRICGYRIVVDQVCGCAEERVYMCCDKVMKKTAAMAAAKKPAKKK